MYPTKAPEEGAEEHDRLREDDVEQHPLSGASSVPPANEPARRHPPTVTEGWSSAVP